MSQAVTPDRELSGLARVSRWDFYHIQIHKGNAVLVQLDEVGASSSLSLFVCSSLFVRAQLQRGLSGLLWLFVQFDRLPSLADYLDGDVGHGTRHSAQVRSGQASENSTLFIGVFGSSRMPPNSSAPFSLSVTTGCKTYSECGRCVNDPDCGW